jgi:hypothetical protein
MTAVDTDGTLYDAREANDPGGVSVYQQFAETTYMTGQVVALYSELLSHDAGGGTGDTISYMKLPPGTFIVGGWFYVENGLQADNKLSNLGIIYEDGDGTDNDEALLQNIDCYDGATGLTAGLGALPAGNLYMIGKDCTTVPYKVTGGIGTVTLTTEDSALVTAKDTKLCLYVIWPGV